MESTEFAPSAPLVNGKAIDTVGSAETPPAAEQPSAPGRAGRWIPGTSDAPAGKQDGRAAGEPSPTASQSRTADSVI